MTLLSWPDSNDAGIPFFSGTAVYRADFVLPDGSDHDQLRWTLDLGTVADIAAVRVNGETMGIAWKPPFEVEVTRAVRTGANSLEIAVINTWKNSLAGDAGNRRVSARVSFFPTNGSGKIGSPNHRILYCGQVSAAGVSSAEAALPLE